jgi:uncharacterized membrane protein
MADALLDRLDELTARMTGIETRLGAVEQALDWRRTIQPTHIPAPPPPAPLIATPPPLPPRLYPTPQPITTTMLAGAAEAAQDAARKRAVVSAWSTHPIPPAPRARKKSLEDLIGRNWTSWIGAIVVVLGVLFFLKYAWDQGWLAMSPAARVATAIATGVAFGATGAWVRRRDMRVLAGTLTGAGVAIVMAAFFAGHTMFDVPVFSARVAMAGVCAAAVAGIWRALRMNVISLAIIALLGAYLAPAILRSGRDESLSLIGYLAALACIGWSLAYLKPRWSAMRWFTWTCTALWMTAWVIWFPMRGQHKPLAMIAVAFFFTGFMAEAFLTLHRALRIRDANDQSAVPGFVGPIETSLATMSMLTTAAVFATYYALLRGTGFGSAGFFHLDPTAAIALGLAALHGMIALATPSRQFARSSILQAAALATLAVPLALGHIAITLAWLVLAVALAALGWRRENRAVRLWAMILLALALARLFTLDRMDASLQTMILHVGGQQITTWLILAWAAAALAHGVGWLMLPAHSESDQTPVAMPADTRAIFLTALGTLVFFVAGVMSWHGLGLTLLWIAGAAALVGLARFGRAVAYAQQAAVLLFVTGIKWLTLDGISPMVAAWNQPVAAMWPVFNSIALAGILLAGLLLWVARYLDEEVRSTMAVAAGVVGFALANFETLRTVDYFAASFADFATAKVVALSVLWAVIGLAAVVVGFARHLRPLRYAALGLLGVTLAKILLVDLAQVRPVYRILSFLAVGGLLLCVSFVYHRHEEQRRAA